MRLINIRSTFFGVNRSGQIGVLLVDKYGSGKYFSSRFVI